MFLSVEPGPKSTRARRIIERLFRDYPGVLAVHLWDGETLKFGQGTPTVKLVFHTPDTLRKLILHGNALDLAEAYFCGDVDIEGDIYQALRLRDHFKSLAPAPPRQSRFTAERLVTGQCTCQRNGACTL